jgi:hypothetical protein
MPMAMDGPTAQLTCELRYNVESVDGPGMMIPGSTANNNNPSSSAASSRTFVEELQDLEVHAAHFS